MGVIEMHVGWIESITLTKYNYNWYSILGWKLQALTWL